MARLNFSIAPRDMAPIADMPRPDVLRFDFTGLQPVVSPGEKVAPGELLAETPVHDRPEIHAPLAGTVRRSSCTYLSMEVAADQPAEEPHPAQALDDPTADSEQLKIRLARSGVSPAGLHQAKALVVNTLEPEPMVHVHAALLKHERETVLAGLEIAKRMVRPERVAVLAARGFDPGFPGLELAKAKAVYPGGLPELARVSAIGSDQPADAAVASVLRLYQIGRATVTDRPLREAVATIGDQVWRIHEGTPVGFALEHAGIETRFGDRVVLGGPMLGEAARDLKQGIPSSACGVFVVPAKVFPPTTDAPCVNCGQCVLACPARIRPDLIAKHAEFKKFDMARKLDIDCCIECGMCGYVCTARRPLLQYIRLAKRELAALREIA